MISARDPTSRLRAGLNPLLTTSLGGYHPPPAGTPLSAVSMTSHNAFSPVPTPVSAIMPYNPQEWIGSPAPGPDRGSNHFAEGAQPSPPPPPPPYSPPRSQRPVSMAFETPPANISATRAPLPVSQRPSPEPSVNQSFAPPPGNAGRGASRERRFGLPSFGRRRDTAEAITPPDNRGSPGLHAPISQPIAPSRPLHAQPIQLSLHIPQQPRIEDIVVSPGAGLAPGSRRAVSTPAAATPTSARSRSASQVRWESSGMPIPPPPPGPPPSSARSQSSSRPNSGSEPITSPPTRRPPPSGVAALGPVPPTPAGWHDANDNNSAMGRSSPNHLSTVESVSSRTSSAADPRSGAVSSANSAIGSHPASVASASTSPGASCGANQGLARTGALRDSKSIRERRTESRTRGIHHSIDASMDAQALSDIVIPGSGSGGLTRRLTINRSTPRSSREVPKSGDVDRFADSKNTTPRALASHPGTPTPPFSPHPIKPQHHVMESPAHMNPAQIAPKALPTPPPQARSSQEYFQGQGPMSPSKMVSKDTVVRQNADQFGRASIERYQAFAAREAAAQTDADRVRLFADFIVSESRIRRERYSGAIGAMGSEIFDLTRDLFRPMVARRESSNSQASAVEFTPQSSETSRSHRGSMNSVYRDVTQAGPSGSNSAPASAGLPMSPSDPPSNWQQQQNYMPSLSPILSMSVSDHHEERSSRGRPASRWWEEESQGEGSVRIERSKRESKYMGVPKEAREALQWIDGPHSGHGPNNRDSTPEKQGWHDQPDQLSTPLGHPRGSLLSPVSAPNTPNPAHLDVSRLVTLPPPYPRHHPAVNNNHPELAETRASVRAISDFTTIDATKARFTTESKAMRESAMQDSKSRRQSMRVNLQAEISSGNMSYAEAGAIEADFETAAKAALKDLEKKDFEHFQAAVIGPLNDSLTKRIETATALIDTLQSQLTAETRQPSPNMPQEEGDEQPELLEKLTLLKWIFEARETLHRAIYDLLSDRNDRYRDMVLQPYRLAGNEEKLANARAFFAEDAAKRQLAFSEEVLRRTQAFRDVVEEAVARGVEVQLSAFWDIAPPLKRLLDKIPLSMAGFAIQIPSAEFEETPSYMQHPLQYLFSLLLHAEKSTYQFIESQTNLLCLLHEVKEAVVTAKARAMEAEGRDARRVEEMRVEEGARLTDDLQEKVRVVRDQWDSALGDDVVGAKERVGGWLLETGGWDESLEDGGVGRS